MAFINLPSAHPTNSYAENTQAEKMDWHAIGQVAGQKFLTLSRTIAAGSIAAIPIYVIAPHILQTAVPLHPTVSIPWTIATLWMAHDIMNAMNAKWGNEHAKPKQSMAERFRSKIASNLQACKEPRQTLRDQVSWAIKTIKNPDCFAATAMLSCHIGITSLFPGGILSAYKYDQDCAIANNLEILSQSTKILDIAYLNNQSGKSTLNLPLAASDGATFKSACVDYNPVLPSRILINTDVPSEIRQGYVQIAVHAQQCQMAATRPELGIRASKIGQHAIKMQDAHGLCP